MGMGGQRQAPAALPPVGPRAGLDGYGKISSPPGFDHRTAQHVASRYTD